MNQQTKARLSALTNTIRRFGFCNLNEAKETALLMAREIYGPQGLPHAPPQSGGGHGARTLTETRPSRPRGRRFMPGDITSDMILTETKPDNVVGSRRKGRSSHQPGQVFSARTPKTQKEWMDSWSDQDRRDAGVSKRKTLTEG